MNDISTSVPPNNPNDPAPPKRRGAPKGNRNARIHGFYSKRTAEANRRVLKGSTDLGGLDREILLAIWQLSVISAKGDGQRAFKAAFARFVRLVCDRYGVRRDNPEGLENAFTRLKYDVPLTPELIADLARAWA